MVARFGPQLKPDQLSLDVHRVSGRWDRLRLDLVGRAPLELDLPERPVAVRVEVLELLLGLQQAYNLTMVYITHDLSTARYFVERIMVM